jgi:hypothetical protein
MCLIAIVLLLPVLHNNLAMQIILALVKGKKRASPLDRGDKGEIAFWQKIFSQNNKQQGGNHV